MTELLRAAMREHAADVDHEPTDVATIVAAGRRRVRGRRIAAGVAAAAATGIVAAGVAVLAPSGGDTPVATGGIDFSALEPSWAVGEVIHYGRDTIEADEPVRSYVLSARGAVYADATGTVRLTTGAGDRTVGRVDPDAAILRADRGGDLAAWVDVSADAPALVVLDTSTGRLVRRVPVSMPAAGPSDNEFEEVLVFAVDGDAVLWLDDDGVSLLDVASGETTVLDPGGDRWSIAGARAGVVLHDGLVLTADRPEGEGGDRLFVSKVSELASGDYARVVRPTTIETYASYGALDPTGERVTLEDEDAYTVFSTSTGAQLAGALDLPGFSVGYDWLADDRTVVMSLPEVGEDSDASRIDIVVCTVPESVCTPYAEGVAAFNGDDSSGFALPIGEFLD